MGPTQATVRPTAIGWPPASEISHIAWGQWGPAEAVGKGLYLDCYTGCGPGSSGPQRVRMLPTTVTLSDPLSTSEGWLFNAVAVAMKGEKPYTEDELVGGNTMSPVVVLPTPANVTGNYLWTGSLEDGLAYVWLSLTQSGTNVTGTEDDGQATYGDPAYISEYHVSGVTSAGMVSLVLTPTSGSAAEPYTTVLARVGVDLRADNKTLVPASWGSYMTAWEAVEQASHQ